MMGNMSSDDKLKQLRDAIDKADNSLVLLLAMRMELVKEIGIYKRERKMAVRDEKRRNEVLTSRIAQGKELGLSEELIRKLFEEILDSAEEIEKK